MTSLIMEIPCLWAVRRQLRLCSAAAMISRRDELIWLSLTKLKRISPESSWWKGSENYEPDGGALQTSRITKQMTTSTTFPHRVTTPSHLLSTPVALASTIKSHISNRSSVPHSQITRPRIRGAMRWEGRCRRRSPDLALARVDMHCCAHHPEEIATTTSFFLRL
jgi:hypothetical protein